MTPAEKTQKAKATEAWVKEVAAMKAKSAGVDWSKVDWSKLAVSDIGVKFGAPMTEEEFLEYRKRQGGRPLHVIKKTVDASDASTATKKS